MYRYSHAYTLYSHIHTQVLAENYLKKGDLWYFLCNINDEINRLKSVVQSNSEIADSMALTFVKHVVKERSARFDKVYYVLYDTILGYVHYTMLSYICIFAYMQFMTNIFACRCYTCKYHMCILVLIFVIQPYMLCLYHV